MNLSFGKKRHYSLAGSSTTLVLAEIIKSAALETANFNLLARTDSGINDETSLPRLLATVSGTKGKTSVVLPLSSFQVITISLPQMPEGAIAKALPYHISKVIDRPLSDFVFDWQLTAVRGNQLDITVYLLSTVFFERLQRELARKQLEVTFLEADVFAAFAYLERSKKLIPDESTMLALLWPQGASFAIYENRVLSLVRDVNMAKPSQPYSTEIIANDATKPAAPEEKKSVQRSESNPSESDDAAINFFFEEENNTDILAGFDVQTLRETKVETTIAKVQTEPPIQEAVTTTPVDESWPEYLQKISLELMRTRDYHATVLKGRPLSAIYVAGADEYWQALNDAVKNSLGVQIKPLTTQVVGDNCPAILSVILQGAGTRW